MLGDVRRQLEVKQCIVVTAKSTTTLLLDFGFQGRSLKEALKELSEAAVKASQWLWLRRSQSTWGHVNDPVLREEGCLK